MPNETALHGFFEHDTLPCVDAMDWIPATQAWFVDMKRPLSGISDFRAQALGIGT